MWLEQVAKASFIGLPNNLISKSEAVQIMAI
jgi:hypothetical protein